MMKASVLENVSRFGRFYNENVNYKCYFRAALLPSPIPPLIAYKAASSISELLPPIPPELTAPALSGFDPHTAFPISNEYTSLK